jgi:hypothetical protein
METDEQKQERIKRLQKRIETRGFIFGIACMLFAIVMVLPVPILIRLWANTNPDVATIIESGYGIVAYVVVWIGILILSMIKVVNMGRRDEEIIKQLRQELGETEEE